LSVPEAPPRPLADDRDMIELLDDEHIQNITEHIIMDIIMTIAASSSPIANYSLGVKLSFTLQYANIIMLALLLSAFTNKTYKKETV
jgi:hypothetical protein